MERAALGIDKGSTFAMMIRALELLVRLVVAHDNRRKLEWPISTARGAIGKKVEVQLLVKITTSNR